MTTGAPQGQAQHGSGISLAEFCEDAGRLSPSDFEERHGAGFLLLTATPLQVPTGPAMTEVNLDGDEPGSACTADVALLAYPLARSERSAGHLITLGRTSNNDVVIPDLSVSRFHAFLKPGPNGGFQLQDANSTNGTTVNGTSVPAQGHGAAMDLKSGDSVRVGQVEFTFLSAPALQDFARAHDR
jgi:hypothetical protein